MTQLGSMEQSLITPLKTVQNVVKKSESSTIWMTKEISSHKQTWKIMSSLHKEVLSNNSNPSLK